MKSVNWKTWKAIGQKIKVSERIKWKKDYKDFFKIKVRFKIKD